MSYLELKSDPEVQQLAVQFESPLAFSYAYAEAWAHNLSVDPEQTKKDIIQALQQVLAAYAESEANTRGGRWARAMAWVASRVPVRFVLNLFSKPKN